MVPYKNNNTNASSKQTKKPSCRPESSLGTKREETLAAPLCRIHSPKASSSLLTVPAKDEEISLNSGPAAMEEAFTPCLCREERKVQR